MNFLAGGRDGIHELQRLALAAVQRWPRDLQACRRSDAICRWDTGGQLAPGNWRLQRLVFKLAIARFQNGDYVRVESGPRLRRDFRHGLVERQPAADLAVGSER